MTHEGWRYQGSAPLLKKKEVKQMALDKTKVVYQIYPKSYKDTTGNGIG